MLEGHEDRMNNETILVNGTLYDAITGMPVSQPKQTHVARTPDARQKKPSASVHKRVEPSRAVNRRAAVAPTQPAITTAHAIQKRSQIQRTMRQAPAKNPTISRFATPQASKATNRPRVVNDIRPATTHPLAKRAEERIQQTHLSHAPAAIKPSTIIKKDAITEALDKAPRHNTIKPKRSFRTSRALSFASMAMSLLLLAGYLTYINLPNLSVRVAASQAGIDATYPGYKPDGYRLAGVNYDQGSVSLKFAANAGPQNFTITQQQTSWDSTAVKENYVKTNWGDDVVPYSERGLTIYAHDGNAAWVNGGILYTITGDAPLSSSQVRGIAVSL